MRDDELALDDGFLLVARLAVTRFRNSAFEMGIVAGVAVLGMERKNMLNNLRALSVALRAVLLCESELPRMRLMASGADLMALNKYFLVGVVPVAILAPGKRRELPNLVGSVAVPAVNLHCGVFIKE